MKIAHPLLVIALPVYLVSCNSGSENPIKADDMKSALAGRWELQKEEKNPSDEKGIAYSNQPTDVILKLEKNGYFLLYDTVLNPEWKSKGLPLITERSKGQWDYLDNKLVLNHTGKDTSYLEELEVSKVDDATLITRGKDKKSNIYKTYQK